MWRILGLIVCFIVTGLMGLVAIDRYQKHQALQPAKAVLDTYLESLQQGHTATARAQWSVPDVAPTFHSLNRWSYLRSSPGLGKDGATFRLSIESSAASGTPIRENWTFYLRQDYAGELKIITASQ